MKKYFEISITAFFAALIAWRLLNPVSANMWWETVAIGTLIVSWFLVWDYKNTIQMIKATGHEFRIEARGFWFIIKTQPLWFSFIATIYMIGWRIPVSLVLGIIALNIALLAIAIRTFYEFIAPQIQAPWVPDSDAYVKSVTAYYKKCEAEYEISRAKAEKKMRRDGK